MSLMNLQANPNRAPSAPAAVVLPQPEIAAVPVTPAERLASHVEWVREQGDAYDSRRTLWPSHMLKLGALAGGLGSTLVTSAGEGSKSGLEVTAASLLVTGVYTLAAIKGREAAVA